MTTLIGKPARRGDLVRKVRGEVRYTDDIQLPRMLHAKLLRSPHAHARILNIDPSPALALPGVIAVITGRDMPTRFGIIPWTPDEYPLALETTRFIGDAVAAVAAVDERTADEARRLVRVEYEKLPTVLDLETAVQHPEVGLGARGGDNVSKRVDLSFGDVDGALAASDAVIEGEYFFEGTAHAPIETHCAIGQFDGSGLLTCMGTSTQAPALSSSRAGRECLAFRPLDPSDPTAGRRRVRRQERAVPRSSVCCPCQTRHGSTGRLVKILYTREEEFYAHRGRHPMHMKFRVGARSDGVLTGVDARHADRRRRVLFVWAGYHVLLWPAAHASILCAQLSLFFQLRLFHQQAPMRAVKRGHGSVQPRFAFEITLDKLAERLTIDPIDLRRKNAVPPHTTTVNGMRAHFERVSRVSPDAVEKASGWKERRGKLGFGRGLGVAASAYISGTNYPIYPNEMPQSAVQLKADRSGVGGPCSTALARSGQGTDTLLGQPSSRGGTRTRFGCYPRRVGRLGSVSG